MKQSTKLKEFQPCNQQSFHQELHYSKAFALLRFLSKTKAENLLFLDSGAHEDNTQSKSHQRWPTGRYSYICFDPVSVIQTRGNQTYIDGKLQTQRPFDKPFTCVKQVLETLKTTQNNFECDGDLPPFRGGLAGYFGYELLHNLENIPNAAEKNPPFESIDDMHLCVYDLVFSFDHLCQKAWVFSTSSKQRFDYALALYEAHLKAADSEAEPTQDPIAPPLSKVNTDSTQAEFEASIQKTIDYIYAGDIFQANITRRLYGDLPENIDLVDLYQRLRTLNPAPFSGFLQWNVHTPQYNPEHMPMAILSSSPERFIKLSATGHIETRPIKGTRPRGKTAEEDQIIQNELLSCEKDNAENIMIVDLMRNDISRVAEPFSVKTPVVCGLESYETVHHLVSTVVGQLQPEYDAVDLLKATFPGGSITGAPKVRAMEIITELEPARRGPYCGSLGYIGLDGAMDTSIMIRTLVVNGGEISFHVGGGIVADSNPTCEYDETVVKGRALLKTLTGEIE